MKRKALALTVLACLSLCGSGLFVKHIPPGGFIL
jgi:hypothetical protein